MKRRGFVVALGLGVALAAVGAPRSAWAGTYLTRAALLVDSAQRETETLRRRLADKELAALVHRLAEARLEVARKMLVPKEVGKAHPHLLLVLEAHERAAEAALRGAHETFLVQHRKGLEEASTLRAVLKQLGYEFDVDGARTGAGV